MPASPHAARLLKHSPDVVLGALLLLIIALLIVPIPTALLDVLIAGNIALAVVMLLVAMAVPHGLGFAAMPTVLLVTTLYRLALNVSSTRLILLQADAGQVIRAFGHYVVRGDYAVGAVIFFILTLIQYVVIARGAERVAEVGARFTLDAMPGKQLAIDADLRAGLRTPDEARQSRRALERENQFYGAMDGAMRFVKGDAIAAIVITIVNIVAGAAIGVGMRDLDLVSSLRVYGLLTIGDGLVCQIPALLISVSAGLVVTRVASDAEHGSLGHDLQSQLFGNARVLWMAAVFLALMALVPGLPAVPFALLALALGSVAYLRRRLGRAGPAASPRAVQVEALAELSVGIAPGRALPELESELQRTSAELGSELGLALWAPRVLSRPHLRERAYQLELHEVPRATGESAVGSAPQDAARQIAGELATLVRAHATELIGLQQTQQLLDALARTAPALVSAVVPRPVSLPLLTAVLRGLLAERVSIRPLAHILEAMAHLPPDTTPARALEHVRLSLRRHILAVIATEGVLVVHPVDFMIEDAIRDSAGPNGAGVLPPDLARDITRAVRSATSAGRAGGVLLVQPDVRAPLRRLLEAELPHVPVLSYPELVPEIRVERRAAVRITAAQSPA